MIVSSRGRRMIHAADSISRSLYFHKVFNISKIGKSQPIKISVKKLWVSMFTQRKGILERRDWDRVSIIYNPLILSRIDKTINETFSKQSKRHFCSKDMLVNYQNNLGQLLEEKGSKTPIRQKDTRAFLQYKTRLRDHRLRSNKRSRSLFREQ